MTTIRQSLRGWYLFLWIGLVAVGILAGSWRPHTWLLYYLRMAVLTFLAVSVIGVFAFGYVCPRCRANLVSKTGRIFNGRPCVCPKCGVSVDEPVKSDANLT